MLGPDVSSALRTVGSSKEHPERFFALYVGEESLLFKQSCVFFTL